MPATALYRSLLLAVERRRLKLGWPMHKLDDAAGSQDGYYSKCLYADTPSGRIARWDTLQWFIDALWPDGVGAQLTGQPVPDEDALRQRVSATARRYRKRYREQVKIRPHLRSYASAKEVRPRV
jgi:hypothetical protein